MTEEKLRTSKMADPEVAFINGDQIISCADAIKRMEEAGATEVSIMLGGDGVVSAVRACSFFAGPQLTIAHWHVLDHEYLDETVSGLPRLIEENIKREAVAALVDAGADDVEFRFSADEDVHGVGVCVGSKRNAVAFRDPSRLVAAVATLKEWLAANAKR